MNLSNGGRFATGLVAMLMTGVSLPAQAQAPHQNADAESPEAQAQALVAKMTLDEKLDQLVNTAPAIPRLGVPAYNWWNEALHGLVADVATTNFPEPIGLAATFDTPMVQQVATAVSEEAVANHARPDASQFGSGLDVWAPNINIFRDPRWGRGQETYGEDPFLTARMGVAYIEGLQGPDPDHPRVIATPKHYVVHSGPEPLRHVMNVDVSPHDLEDTYLPAFRAAIVDAKAGSVMCAYNSVDGEPACANDALLKTKLRGEWGFKGYVVSDCGAVTDISDTHKYTRDRAAAEGAAFRAGVDNECTIDTLAGRAEVQQRYRLAVERGDLPVADVDRSLVRLFTARYRVGAMGSPDAAAAPVTNLSTPAHVALAEEVAEKSLVLLKNNGVLPLARDRKIKVAVIGPLADATRVLRGNYSSGISLPPVSVLDGLRAAMPDAEIDYVPAGPFPGDGDVVPQSALSTPDGKPGLEVSYYSAKPDDRPATPGGTIEEVVRHALGAQFEDKPAAVATDSEVNRTTDLKVPTGVAPLFRAVWRGYVTAPVTGTYRLGLKGNWGVLSFDGKPLVSLAASPPAAFDMKVVQLEAGKKYPIEITAPHIGVTEIHLIWNRISENQEADAIAAANKADVVIAVVGLTSDLEGEENAIAVPGFKGGDRTSLDLPADEQKLLDAAKSTGKPLVVVNMSGSAVNLAWAKQNADAIVQAWYPGQQGGLAVAKVLSGAVNPAGRLPITFYHSVADLPDFSDYSMKNRTYRYYTGTPVYPFGYGLSYTSFSYTAPVITRRGDGYVVRTTVANTGKRAGDEVAQLYLRFPAKPGVPNIALRGFSRIHLTPGERKAVSFHLTPRDLSSVAPDGKRSVLAGTYRVIVGGGQPAAGVATASATLQVADAMSIAP